MQSPSPREPFELAPELTPREREIVARAAVGQHPKLIAYELGIAAVTVRVLLARAARRLGALSRSELVEKWRAAEARVEGAGGGRSRI